MKDIIEIYDNYNNIGVKNRTITEGKEIELVREYINFRKSEFQPTENRKLAIFLEAKVDNAYPDIVFVEYSPENYINWNEARAELNKDDLKILYHIYITGGIDSTGLVKQLGVNWKEAMLAIEKLSDADLIIRNYKKWKIKDEKKLTTYTIEAVEAKLNNWDEVLQQSIINKNFASESYALSIMKSKPKEETLKKFRKFGVGVYLKNENGFKRIKKARSVNMPVSFNSIFFNEWIGRIINLG
ncbi:hypothetical protein ACWYRQ_07105 [Clostridioides difficile]